MVRKKLGARLDLRAAFDAPTLADMARLIESAPRADGEHEAIAPAPDGPAPATPTQEEIHRWLSARPSSPAYNVDGAVRLSGHVDPLAFARAFDALAARHEALRTGLRLIDGELKQIALPPRAVFEHLDLGGLPDAARQAEAAARRNVLRPFDLKAGPLLRALLVSAGPTDHILTIVAHHAVVDAQAMDVLLEELSLLLNGRPLVPAPQRLRDYACWRRSRDAGPEFERRLAQARERLSGAWSAWPVAPDRPAGAGFSDAGARVRFEIAAPLVASLHAQATAARASLPILILAALGATLCRWARVERVGLEVLTSDRRHPDAERIVGVLIDSDVAIVRAPEDMPFRETLAAVRDDRLAAEAAPPVPFRRLIEAVADKNEPPLEVLFNYLRRAAAPARSLAGVPIEDFPTEIGAETHPLEFDFIEDADGRLACSVGYLTALFDPATVEGFLAAFRSALATITADPRAPASHLTRRDHVDH